MCNTNMIISVFIICLSFISFVESWCMGPPIRLGVNLSRLSIGRPAQLQHQPTNQYGYGSTNVFVPKPFGFGMPFGK
uniref:Secreted protein n=1 Tax=Heterorhabditis bacteriophora TaxID=37862 RepID=A0A1I7XI73_HETBA